MGSAIKADNLTKQFGKLRAVGNLTLDVPEGSIYAFLGPNGAGKTTTIKLLMNIIRPTEGSSSVLGVDSGKLAPDNWRQIGYVSENQKMPEWMTVDAFLKYCRPMYPNWDDDLCAKLLKRFDLPLNQKLSAMSRGMKVKAALLSSLAYRPRLLVLDEPFTGLDPLVRDEFIRGILELTESEHWTIFVSTHDIGEVEQLADWVGIIDRGELKLSEKLEVLQARFRKIEITSEMPMESLPEFHGHWLLPEHQGRVTTFIETQYECGKTESLIQPLFPNGAIAAKEMTLREIFVALAKTYTKNQGGKE
ncbi:MAG: ABC transporter ATP-binding protein [Victivallales bacterium]